MEKGDIIIDEICNVLVRLMFTIFLQTYSFFVLLKGKNTVVSLLELSLVDLVDASTFKVRKLAVMRGIET